MPHAHTQGDEQHDTSAPGHAAHAHGDAHAHPHDHAHSPSAKPRAASGCGCSGPAGDDAHDDHAGHDHGVLPGWPRIAAALVVALGAEVCHWLAHDPQSGLAWLKYLGMALAVLGIALAGLGVYKSGIKSLLRGHLGIHALMAVAVTGAFLIGQWPEAAM